MNFSFNDGDDNYIYDSYNYTFDDLVLFCSYLDDDRYEVDGDVIRLKSNVAPGRTLTTIHPLQKKDDYSVEIIRYNEYFETKIIKWYEDADDFLNQLRK